MPATARRANRLIARGRGGSLCRVSPKWARPSPTLPARAGEARLLLQRLAKLAQRFAELAGQRGVGIARRAQQAGPAILPQAAEPVADCLILDHLGFPILHLGADLRIVLEIPGEARQPF